MRAATSASTMPNEASRRIDPLLAEARTLVPSVTTSSRLRRPSTIIAAMLRAISLSRSAPFSTRNSAKVVWLTPTPPQIQR